MACVRAAVKTSYTATKNRALSAKQNKRNTTKITARLTKTSSKAITRETESATERHTQSAKQKGYALNAESTDLQMVIAGATNAGSATELMRSDGKER